eukprot:2433193-Pyramimonas_sp.AAC.1
MDRTGISVSLNDGTGRSHAEIMTHARENAPSEGHAVFKRKLVARVRVFSDGFDFGSRATSASSDADIGAPDLVEQPDFMVVDAGGGGACSAGGAQPVASEPAPGPPAPNFVDADLTAYDIDMALKVFGRCRLGTCPPPPEAMQSPWESGVDADAHPQNV